jgi:hypothetical protein
MARPIHIFPQTLEEERRAEEAADLVLRARPFLRELLACCAAILEASQGTASRSPRHPHIQQVLRIQHLAGLLLRFERQTRPLPRMKLPTEQ